MRPPARLLTPLLAALACTPTGAEAPPAADVIRWRPGAVEGPTNVPTAYAPLTGRCNGAKPVGDPERFEVELQTHPGDGGYIRVRANAAWSARDTSNVLGVLVGARNVRALGPLKARPSQGVGFAVPVRDEDGATCMGYVSATVVSTRG